MDTERVFNEFLDALVEAPGAYKSYVWNSLWTQLATAALIKAGLAAAEGHGKKLCAAARNHKDERYGRSEYLTLDACIYDDDNWGPPLFIAEHENSKYPAKVQYCAWKLLVTEARCRVLVAYYTTDLGLDGLVDALRTVAGANARMAPRGFTLIAAPYEGQPESNAELRSMFELREVTG